MHGCFPSRFNSQMTSSLTPVSPFCPYRHLVGSADWTVGYLQRSPTRPILSPRDGTQLGLMCHLPSFLWTTLPSSPPCRSSTFWRRSRDSPHLIKLPSRRWTRLITLTRVITTRSGELYIPRRALLGNLPDKLHDRFRVRFYQVALKGGCFAKEAAYWIRFKGRMKYCRPIYSAVYNVDKDLARNTFNEFGRGFLHPIARRLIAKVSQLLFF